MHSNLGILHAACSSGEYSQTASFRHGVSGCLIPMLGYLPSSWTLASFHLRIESSNGDRSANKPADRQGSRVQSAISSGLRKRASKGKGGPCGAQGVFWGIFPTCEGGYDVMKGAGVLQDGCRVDIGRVTGSMSKGVVPFRSGISGAGNEMR
ncbi:uncharacterized protein BO66DRAFT_183814 [Aspergillus aculeatinus CBS 121060]|uniref:Uncharacterized protein n=1 Tax=Aspergillus aculeatinus CBS 121060 TaxID=1448322 RepID=A0ACD1GXX5_9EURO|nr:hypothetical protein BO66DRAFT_183814 [Aspergillus aculeatinus CBS 121060]RAH66332.1 hypothetical protein BO66DRAFT_183814 [Aspergillus aculeatinus CBS 121060]